jgi:hypothetical protein
LIRFSAKRGVIASYGNLAEGFLFYSDMSFHLVDSVS